MGGDGRADRGRMRGSREVTRLEGFSDAVFGFALTLLAAFTSFTAEDAAERPRA